jgi:glutathione S-transferase
MKLYYSPGACSLSPHIALIEAGLPFEAVLASTKTHQLPDGTDYYTINPKGYVPTLEFDSGERLTEGPAIVQWIADQVPERQLAPAAGTLARYQLMAWLNFTTAELHKGFGLLFNPAMPEQAKALARAKLQDRFTWVDSELAERPWLMGESFTVADIYLFVMSTWAPRLGLDLHTLTRLKAFHDRVEARPAVQQAMKAEGLIS